MGESKKSGADRKSSKTIRPSNQFGSLPISATPPVVDDTVIPLLDAWFIEVFYSSGLMCLVNTECSILHLLLHLKEKYLAEDECLDGVVIVNPDEDPTVLESYSSPPIPSFAEAFSPCKSPNKKPITKQQTPPVPKHEPSVWCLDLVSSDTGVPLDLCYKPRTDFLQLYVRVRQQYYICKVKKNLVGTTRDVVPLFSDPPAELLEHIDQHLKLLERHPKKRESTSKKDRNAGKTNGGKLSGISSRTSLRPTGSNDTLSGMGKRGSKPRK